MKTFIIQEKFVGYADITIEAETEEEAVSLYNRGYYPDSSYDRVSITISISLIMVFSLDVVLYFVVMANKSPLRRKCYQINCQMFVCQTNHSH